MLAIESPQGNCWLVDSAADVHVCNDRALMMEYRELPTRIGGSTSDGVSSGRRRVRLRLALKDGSKSLILNLQNVYYLPYIPCNLVSLGLLHDSRIFYDNKNETLYQVKSRQTLAKAQRWRNSYLLKPLNLSDGAINLLWIDDLTYQPPHVLQSTTAPMTTTLTTWHKRLGHTNFSSLKTVLRHLNIIYIDDSKDFTCDSCQRAKATKVHNRQPQTRAQRPYQFVYTDLIGPINPMGLIGKRYFFTFTDDCTRMTETYTGTKKSDWLRCLKTYQSL